MNNMKFEFTIGNGMGASSLILANPKFDGGILRATQVAELEYREYNGTPVYRKCDAREVIIGGGLFFLSEYKGEIN